MLEALNEFHQEITEKFSKLFNSVEKMFEFVRSIDKTVHNQNCRYKIIFKPNSGNIEHYNFDCCCAYSDGNYLDDFKTGADLKAGDQIVAHNDYYEPAYLTVEKRIYSINENTIFLVCSAVEPETVDYIYTDEFESYVEKLSETYSVQLNTRRELEKCAYDPKQSDEEKMLRFHNAMATVIWKKYIDGKQLTSMDFFNTQEQIKKVLAKIYNYEYHRPSRSEFSDY